MENQTLSGLARFPDWRWQGTRSMRVSARQQSSVSLAVPKSICEFTVIVAPGFTL